MFSERKKRKKIIRLSYSQTPCWHSHLEAAQIWSHIYSPCCRFSNWYYTHPSVMKSMSRISMKAPCCGLWAVFSRGKRLWPYVHIKVTPCRTLLEIRRLKTHSSLNAPWMPVKPKPQYCNKLYSLWHFTHVCSLSESEWSERSYWVCLALREKIK